jgi:hypothetical protein
MYMFEWVAGGGEEEVGVEVMRYVGCTVDGITVGPRTHTDLESLPPLMRLPRRTRARR